MRFVFTAICVASITFAGLLGLASVWLPAAFADWAWRLFLSDVVILVTTLAVAGVTQRVVAIALALLLPGAAAAQDQITFPTTESAWFVNRDGSCVQNSLGMCGLWQNTPSATYLLWDTEYGARVRGGSYPSRVEQYCDRRGIPAYNVTGETTIAWMKWASKTNRLCAIGCYPAHFQTLLHYNPDPSDKRPWKVKNNWGVSGSDNVTRYNEFSEDEFRKHHYASGRWVVILKTPPPPARPKYVAWWQ